MKKIIYSCSFIIFISFLYLDTVQADQWYGNNGMGHFVDEHVYLPHNQSPQVFTPEFFVFQEFIMGSGTLHITVPFASTGATLTAFAQDGSVIKTLKCSESKVAASFSAQACYFVYTDGSTPYIEFVYTDSNPPTGVQYSLNITQYLDDTSQLNDIDAVRWAFNSYYSQKYNALTQHALNNFTGVQNEVDALLFGLSAINSIASFATSHMTVNKELAFQWTDDTGKVIDVYDTIVEIDQSLDLNATLNLMKDMQDLASASGGLYEDGVQFSSTTHEDLLNSAQKIAELYATGNFADAYRQIAYDFARAAVYAYGVFESFANEEALDAVLVLRDLLHEDLVLGARTSPRTLNELDALIDYYVAEMNLACNWWEDFTAGCGYDFDEQDRLHLQNLYYGAWDYMVALANAAKQKVNPFQDIDGDGVLNPDDPDPVDRTIPAIPLPDNAPTAVISPVTLSTTIGNNIMLNGSTSFDQDGDQISSYTWSLYSPGSSTAQITSGSTNSTYSFNASSTGTYTVELVVTANNLDSLPVRSTIAVDTTEPVVNERCEKDECNLQINGLYASKCTLKQLWNFSAPANHHITEVDLWASSQPYPGTYSYEYPYYVFRIGSAPVMNSEATTKCNQGYAFSTKITADHVDTSSIGTYLPGDPLNSSQRVYVAIVYPYDVSDPSGLAYAGYEFTNDTDNDDVPDYLEDPVCIGISTDSFDSDGDNVCDNQDKFDNDPGAWKDSDNDGCPDLFTGQSTTGLLLDAEPTNPNVCVDSDGDHVDDRINDLFPNNPDEWSDSDLDGIGDNSDAFPLDVAASVNNDGDLNCADEWNIGKTQADSTTGLVLDIFPNNPNECLDTDGDGYGDNSDWAPLDASEWIDSDGDNVGDNADAAPFDATRTTNTPPTIVPIDDLIIEAGDSLIVDIISSDIDGDAVSIALIVSPGFVSLTENVLTISPQANELGLFSVVIRATDSYNGETLENLLVDVQSIQAPPVTTTTAATGITQTGATLNATVNPSGSATTLYFDYGNSTSYGSTTAGMDVGSGTSEVAQGIVISGLECGATYHYQAYAVNAGGTTTGGDASFTTDACPVDPPVTTTTAATGVTQTGATLNATVNPNGSATMLYFDYGTSTAYGSTTAGVDVPSGSSVVAQGSAISGLECGATYHYQARAVNAGGTTTGGNASFTTDACEGEGSSRKISPIWNIMMPIITSLEVGLPTVDSYAGLVMTVNSYDYGYDYNDACVEEYGADYRQADWNELVDYHAQGGSLAELVSRLGFDVNKNVWVTRDGVASYSSTRDYFASYHSHDKPDSYLAHDNIDDYFFSLGSWYGSRPVLCSIN